MLQLTSDPKRTALLLLAGVVAVAALLFLWWPAGTVLGLVAGGFAVHRIGTAMQRAAESQPWADLHDVTAWLDGHEPHREPEPAVLVPASLAPAPEPAVARSEPAPVPVLRDEVRGQLTGLKTQL
ncbi:MAG TPA: hypothetical protein VGC94_10705, partial [Amnibacterium sp.]